MSDFWKFFTGVSVAVVVIIVAVGGINSVVGSHVSIPQIYSATVSAAFVKRREALN